MADYAEEQKNEIEALESIYPEELEILEVSPYVFTLKISSQNSDESCDAPDRAECTIKFTYTPKYPDEAPLMEIESSENLDEEQQDMVLQFINEQVEENMGTVMVFTIVSALQEKLTVLMEDTKRLAEEHKLQKLRDEEEAERKRFEGTRVTIESFLAWKSKFDFERLEKKRLLKEADQANKKVSGKELFMMDASLNESDVSFLQNEGESVEVDESLFQDMEDLDFDEADDNDEDDPDYAPGS